ncbi:MAG TPA: DUF4399 domain-containing protein [Actinomycetota bacterium]|nr:DUF4399 domain-containing protein [Actinomycetota bacterium]
MLRAGLLAVLIVVAFPATAYAHVVGPSGGVELELLLIAVALLVAAFLIKRTDEQPSRVPVVLLVLGVGLGIGSVAWPRLGQPPSTTSAVVTIVSPTDGATVPAGRPVDVTVELANAPLARSATSQAGGHLHLYVDGQLQQMPYSLTAEIELEPGSHELTVEYVDAQHVSFDPPVQTTVSVTAE